jgi:tRNA(adenine34) deaminase
MTSPLRPADEAGVGQSTLRRRQACAALLLLIAPVGLKHAVAAPGHPDPRWYEAAEAMRQLALGWGDQSYGAVLVQGGAVIGEGPSRVIRNKDPNAHAEREAIRDAQRRLGTKALAGSVLYSTSRPCRLCEEAAAAANVDRMYFGPGLVDAGRPRG